MAFYMGCPDPAYGRSTMQRLKPDPVPPVRPVPEYLAEPDLARRYEDMKAVFQVPWMGVVTMAFAHYRDFFDALWRGTRELCASTAWVEACGGLRRFVEDGIGTFDPPPAAARLGAEGYAPRELDALRETVEVFSHGNFPYLMLATVARMLLETDASDPLTGGVAVEPFDGRHAPDVAVPFVLMERHHAAAETRAVYDDVMATLGLPFVNTDYRAFSRWPSWFDMAWSDLKPAVQGEAYEPFVATVHERAVTLAAGLPNPGGLSADALAPSVAAAPDGEVLAVVRLFQWLLPGLVTNVAFFRHQLQPG